MSRARPVSRLALAGGRRAGATENKLTDRKGVNEIVMFPARIGHAVQPAILSARLQKRGQVEGLKFGHSGSVNPEGCQRVAGGRRGFLGRRPPGNGAGEVLHPGWGARPGGQMTRSGGPCRRQVATLVRSPRFWHPFPGCSAIRRRLPVVVSPLPRTTSGYRLPTQKGPVNEIVTFVARIGQSVQPATLSARLQKRGQVFPAGHSQPSIQLNCIVVLALVVLMRAVLPRLNAFGLNDSGLDKPGTLTAARLACTSSHRRTPAACFPARFKGQ
jgi:hypothetical protein